MLPSTPSEPTAHAHPLWRLESAAWFVAGAIVTTTLVAVRASVGTTHVALAYLLLVLCASARCGRRVGLSCAAAAFLAFNFYFVRPYGTFQVHDPLDWIVLFAFLVTGAVAAQLLHRAQLAAAQAHLHLTEVRRLAILGAEALQAARAEDAAAAIARVIREELGVRECELFLRDPATDRLHFVASANVDETRGSAGTARTTADVLLTLDPRTFVLPLEVRDRQVGLLFLRADTPLPITTAQHPFAEALAYYAALGLERVRLALEAERAEALRATDRLKDAMLSAVSHDLRTPLTTIKAVAHQIASDDARAVEIEEEADRLSRYVTNLLDLSRINAGAVPVQPEAVPVDEMLGVLLQQTAGAAGEERVQLTLPADWTALVGWFDYALTLRVLTNLVENALRYSPTGADVEMRAERAGGAIRFEVADRGPGIAPHDRERVFEPFWRGSSGSETPGTGLGLAIARQLTEAQGGTLELVDRPGGGAVFVATLPAADHDALRAASL